VKGVDIGKVGIHVLYVLIEKRFFRSEQETIERRIAKQKREKEKTIDSPQKIGLVSRNYQVTNDFSEYMPKLIDIADKNNCDTLIYSMWSLDDSIKKVTKNQVFQNSKNIKRVILETGNFDLMSDLKTEIWFKDKNEPRIIFQRFAKAREEEYKKELIVERFFERIIEDCFILLCGETNIIKYKQKLKRLDDKYHLIDIFEQFEINFIFNPVHDYMIRHEMKKKRAFLSLNNRYVISIWNTGKISSTGKKIAEAKIPWTVFFNGQDVTGRVDEISPVISGNHDIRFGILPV